MSHIFAGPDDIDCQEKSTTVKVSLNQQVVLVADDSAMSQKTNAAAVRTVSNTMTVVKANSPDTAWGIWRTQHPFLLILDNSMPNQDDGLNMIRRIRDDREDLQPGIILCSGDDINRQLEGELNFTFVKKGSNNDLTAAIRAAMGKQVQPLTA